MFKRFKNIYLALTIFIFCCVLIFGKQYIGKIVFAEKSVDAIAIRIIANPEHYSAIHWYKEQNFKGSPQSIIIDGYSGIRDGRTVYVNVGNISLSNVLYTNIYLISYNQQAKKQTIDIFSQILNHWKFNTNVLTIGQCSENNNVNCVLDSDCQNNEYCNSQKAKIIRDVNRMENLVELNKAIEKYKNIHNYYPKLNAGSYLPNKTISVWPSWQKVLAQDLAMKLPDDPINKLGDCGDDRFHSITCWDKDNKEFADSDLTDPDINLPENSKVYVYTTTKSGSSYKICAVMESGYVQGLENGSCAESESYIKFGETDNHVPEINCGDLSGHPGKKFIGNIRANDIDGDLLVWSIDTSGTNWITDDWSDAPILQDMFIDNHKKIYAEKAGDFGVYSIKIKVDDNRGGVIEKECSINITVNSSPTVSVSCNVNTRINKVYDCNGISAIDPDGDNIADYIFEGLPSGLSANGPIISGIPNTDGNYVISVKAVDEYGAESYSKSFTLNVNTYCGDSNVQVLNMESISEECDYGTENTDVPCLPAYDSSCNYCDTSCSLHNVQGAFCGDGNIDTSHEECDQNETDIHVIKNVLEIVQQGITNDLSDAEITVMYQNACASDCVFGCLADIDELGQGCYIGICQKGKWACADDHITLICENVFNTPGHPDYINKNLYDYCCDENKSELQDGNIGGTDFVILYAKDYIGSGSFHCDDICRMEGKICVGIGLSNVAQDSCIQIVHDVGNNCSLGVNQATNNCTAQYLTGYNQCIDREGEYFRVGETACYCF